MSEPQRHRVSNIVKKIKAWVLEHRAILIASAIYALSGLAFHLPPYVGWYYWEGQLKAIVTGIHGLGLVSALIIGMLAYEISGNFLSLIYLQGIWYLVYILVFGLAILLGIKKIRNSSPYKNIIVLTLIIIQLVAGFFMYSLSGFSVSREPVAICEYRYSNISGRKLIIYKRHTVLWGSTDVFFLETDDGGDTWEQVDFEHYGDWDPSSIIDDMNDQCELSRFARP
jgi:hypothetical protein